MIVILAFPTCFPIQTPCASIPNVHESAKTERQRVETTIIHNISFFLFFSLQLFPRHLRLRNPLSSLVPSEMEGKGKERTFLFVDSRGNERPFLQCSSRSERPSSTFPSIPNKTNFTPHSLSTHTRRIRTFIPNDAKRPRPFK